MAKDGTELPADVRRYLEPGIYVDSDNTLVRSTAQELCGRESAPIQRAKSLFEFVRDRIEEGDFDQFKASEVLKAKKGFCYNKAILLAALCRAAGIPARLAYDEVTIADYVSPRTGQKGTIQFLHGLTEIYLRDRWRRYDQTGNAARWRLGTQSDVTTIALPLEFRAEQDVVFPSTSRIRLSRTENHFFDWGRDAEKLTQDFNRLSS
jgi:transglutaminase-like putative cysteine protease